MEWPFPVKNQFNIVDDTETFEGNERKIVIHHISKMTKQERIDVIIMALKFLKNKIHE